METTFITIHNLSPEANILYASDSITDILGYRPEEVTGRSCFDYFHPEEVPFARNVHNRGVQLDRAAVLHYARIQSRDGEWIGCECVFTVVSDVLVASTSIYKGDAKNERRAQDAPAIRRLFASSPRDPRYHMLEHLSPKFKSPPRTESNEPRAALFLNRFTRELRVMYATSAVESILGVRVDQVTGKSFYECIQENCLLDAVRCLEGAKENDSIAYLRFWYRDPRRQEDHVEDREEERSVLSQSDDSDGGVELGDAMDFDQSDRVQIKTEDIDLKLEDSSSGQDSREFSPQAGPSNTTSRTSSGRVSEMEQDAAVAMFDGPARARSSTSSLGQDADVQEVRTYEIEAVISCTSDGLVVVLRRARPRIPSLSPQAQQLQGGIFAAPWAQNPILPFGIPNPQQPYQYGQQVPHALARGPPQEELLSAIREVAVFAWSLVGINGNIADYGHGVPQGQAQPAFGLPIWDPNANPSPMYAGPENQALQRWAREQHHYNQQHNDQQPNYGYGESRQQVSFQSGFGQSFQPQYNQPPAQFGHAFQNQSQSFIHNYGQPSGSSQAHSYQQPAENGFMGFAPLQRLNPSYSQPQQNHQNHQVAQLDFVPHNHHVGPDVSQHQHQQQQQQQQQPPQQVQQQPTYFQFGQQQGPQNGINGSNSPHSGPQDVPPQWATNGTGNHPSAPGQLDPQEGPGSNGHP